MNALAGFSAPGFMPSINNTVYLVGTAADQSRMGGVKNRVYITAQTAYDAAVALRTSIGAGQVYIRVFETTAAQVGNITLAAAFNTNIGIVGTSPIASTIGNITGAGFTISPFLISEITIGNIVTTNTGGAAGTISLKISNAIIGTINTTSTTGAGAAVTINTNSASIINRVCFIASITTTGTGSSASGAVTINGGYGFKIGNITTGSGTTTGGGLNINECDTIGAISNTSTATSSCNINNCRQISSITITGLGSATAINNCVVTGNISHIVGGATAAVLSITNSVINGTTTYSSPSGGLHTFENNTFVGAVNVQSAGSSNAPINRCHFKSTYTNATAVMGMLASNSIFEGNIVTVPGICRFYNCTFNGILSDLQVQSSQVFGAKFFNCVFAVGTALTATSNVYVDCIACGFVNSQNNQFVAIRTEREYVSQINTANATPTTLLAIPIPTGQKARIIANISGTTGGTDVNEIIIANIVKNAAGTLTKVSALDTAVIPPISDVSLSSATAQIGISGTSAIIQVTGIAATTINWTVSVKIILSF